MDRNELCLITGKWTSLIGNIIFDYANSVSIVSLFSSSPLVMGIYQGSESLITIFMNLFGGVAADGNNKKLLLVITDSLSFLVCVITSFFISNKTTATVLILANLILAVVNSFNSPIYSSIIRSAVKKERILRYNSIVSTGSGVIKIAFPLISVMLVNTIGARGAILVNAATFLISAIVETFIIQFDESKCTVIKKRNALQKIGEGIHYITGQQNLFFLILLSAGVNLFLAGYNLLMPYTDVMFRNQFPNFYGRALALQAVGGIIASIMNVKQSKDPHSVPRMIMYLGLTGISLMLIPLVALINSIIINLIPYAVFGAFLTLYNIQFMSYVQITADATYLGRVFSVIFSIAVLFMPVGSFVFSLFLSVQKVSTFGVIGVGIVILALVGQSFIKKE